MQNGYLSRKTANGGWQISTKSGSGYLAENQDISDDVSRISGVEVEFALQGRRAVWVTVPGSQFVINGKFRYTDPQVESLLLGDTGNALVKFLSPNLHPRAATDARICNYIANHFTEISDLDPSDLINSPCLAWCLLTYPALAQTVHDGFPLEGFIGSLLTHARFASGSRPALEGTFFFTDLNPIDLFLGAYYFGSPLPVAFTQCEMEHQWSWELVQSYFPNDQTLYNFLSKGLLPRVAEVVFGEQFTMLTGLSESFLCDNNRSEVATLTRMSLETALKTTDFPPSEDWCWQERKYDVKSNVFYSAQSGLKGFIVDAVEEQKNGVEVPGIIFWSRSKQSCNWSFIGFLNYWSTPETTPFRNATIARPRWRESKKDSPTRARVPVFWFEMPDQFRIYDPVSMNLDHLVPLFECLGGLVEVTILRECSVDPGFRIALSLESSHRREYAHLYLDILECARIETERFGYTSTGATKVGIERILWEAINNLFIQYRSSPEPQSQRAGLLLIDVLRNLFRSTWLPMLLAKGKNGIPLLEHWLDEVLVPLNEHWDSVKCPKCKGKNFTISTPRMIGEAIGGEFECRNEECNFKIFATLLTHCIYNRLHRDKNVAPNLILGLNELCPECGGLICSNTTESGQTCGWCKSSCNRNESRH